MPQLEPALLPVVTDLDRGLRTLGVPFAVVGALVPELLLDVRPARMTNDADVTVVVESLADFETLKDRLADFGFVRTRAAHWMRHHSGGLIDLLPFSLRLTPEGRLELESDLGCPLDARPGLRLRFGRQAHVARVAGAEP